MYNLQKISEKKNINKISNTIPLMCVNIVKLQFKLDHNILHQANGALGIAHTYQHFRSIKKYDRCNLPSITPIPIPTPKWTRTHHYSDLKIVKLCNILSPLHYFLQVYSIYICFELVTILIDVLCTWMTLYYFAYIILFFIKPFSYQGHTYFDPSPIIA